MRQYCGNVLFENIEEKVRDGETVFVYDEYRINVPYRESLAASVEANFDGWLSAAKAHAYNSAAAKVREKRNALIAETDYIIATRLYAVVGKTAGIRRVQTSSKRHNGARRVSI